MKKTTIILFVLLYSLSVFSQKKSYFPIWTFHQDSITINGISVGLGSFNIKPKFTNSNGIKLELIGSGILGPIIPMSPIAENDSAFNEMKKSPVSEVINGIDISPGGTVCDCIINGINFGIVSHIVYQTNGISACVFFNLSQIHSGVQIAIFGNETFISNGVQLAILANKSNRLKGIQIGLFNESKNTRGIQIGLWNKNEKRKLPFFNWNFSK